jgi:hypothetical protein
VCCGRCGVVFGWTRQSDTKTSSAVCCWMIRKCSRVSRKALLAPATLPCELNKISAAPKPYLS